MSVTETPPAWIADQVYASGSRGYHIAYLGSIPNSRKIITGKLIPSPEEYEREDYLTLAAGIAGLTLSIVHYPERRYFFVMAPFGYRANVSKMVFGELTTEDSIGYQSPLQRLGRPDPHGALPMFAINGPHRERLPAPGAEYGPCVEPCDHERCAGTRAIADAPCHVCKNPIGYDAVYFGFLEFGGEEKDFKLLNLYGSRDPKSFVHAGCVEGDYDELCKRVAVFGQQLFPPMKKREAA